MNREARVKRETNETKIDVTWRLDGKGGASVSTGIGFFDHMLEQLARHSLSDLKLSAKGDLHIDDHHTVEDCGWALGQALNEALGDRRGITRYACFDLPMDDSLISMALDISGRPFLVWNVNFPYAKIGAFDSELVREFFQAFSQGARVTLHVSKRSGVNGHHICEACFKALARVLRQAWEIDSKAPNGIASTKGKL